MMLSTDDSRNITILLLRPLTTGGATSKESPLRPLTTDGKLLARDIRDLCPGLHRTRFDPALGPRQYAGIMRIRVRMK